MILLTTMLYSVCQPDEDDNKTNIHQIYCVVKFQWSFMENQETKIPISSQNVVPSSDFSK